MGRKRDSTAAPPAAAENVKVLVRARPLNTKELEAGYKSSVDLDIAEGTVSVNHVCGEPDRWTFDAVINNTFSQHDVFNQHILPLVDSVLEGFNATVFAYGQSGSGKTFTMTGKYDDPELRGIIPRTFAHIFSVIRASSTSNPNRKFNISCSFVELYNGKVRDLLATQQVTLAVKESKDKTFFVQGANIPQVKYPEDLERHMEEGTERRQVASTELNSDSSRSHSIFSLIVESVETTDDGDVRSVTSKLNLVDLAGSERQSKTGAQGETFKEGCNINLSLSALGTVIDTIVKGKGHIPFRSSPLTMLLKDSLGGSSKTVMFANINPSEHNVSETVSTLRFADRAKQIKNKPVVNMDAKDQKIVELTELVNDLRDKLKRYESGGSKGLEEEIEEMRERLGEMEVSLDNAQRGREADALDFSERTKTLEADVVSRDTRIAELEALVEQLRRDVAMLEDHRRLEAASKSDILHRCAEKLESPNPITTVDELIKAFNVIERWASDLRQARREREDAIAERQHIEAHLKMEMEALQSTVQAKQDDLQASEKKVERLREQLEEQLQARRTAADMSLNGSIMTTSSLDINSRPRDTEELIAAEQRLREREAVTMEIQRALYDRLAEVTDSTKIVGQLCELLHAKDNLLNDARTAMADAIAHRISPLSPNRRRMSRATLADAVGVGGSVHASETRNALLQMVATLASNAPCEDDELRGMVEEVKRIVESVREENGQLHKRLAQEVPAPPPLSARRPTLRMADAAPSPSVGVAEAATAEGVTAEAATGGVVAAVRAFVSQMSTLKTPAEVARAVEKLSAALPPIETADPETPSHAEEDADAGDAWLQLSEAQAHLASLTETHAVSQAELANISAELRDESEKRERVERDLAAATEAVRTHKRELAESALLASKLQSQMAEYLEERSRAAALADRHAKDVEDVEQRLKERSAQLAEVRALANTQIDMLNTANAALQEANAQIRALKAEKLDEERKRAAIVAEREEAVQRAANRRMDAMALKHREDMEKKDAEAHKLRKRLRKAEGHVQKAQEQFDQKVCELDELQKIIEEQKVEALRMLRSPASLEIEAQTAHIGDALTRAKEEHKRRNDLFSFGTGNVGGPSGATSVPTVLGNGRQSIISESPTANTRAAGTAASFLRKAAKQ